MPRVMLALPQEAITITRAVVRETVKQFIQLTGFPGDTDLIFQDEFQGRGKQLKNIFTSAADSGVRTQYRNYAFIGFTETYPEDSINQTRWQDTYYKDTYVDSDIGARIKPFYVKAQIEITLKLRSNDLTQLNSWIAGMRSTHALHSMTYRHKLPYEVDVPLEYIDFVHTAWTMREAVGGKGEGLQEYLKRCFKDGLATRSNLSKTATDVIMHEVQENVIGKITGEDFYSSKEIEDGIYEIRIPYKLSYNKPTAMGLIYPATIHNQSIPTRFTKDWLPHIDRDKDPVEVPTYTLDRKGELKDPFYRGDGGTRLVEWDDWFPNDYYKDTQTVTIVPIKVDLSDKKACFNLWDIPEKYLSRAVLGFLRDFNDLQGQHRRSVVTLEVFSVGADDKLLTHKLSKALDLTTNVDMDPTRRHFLRISLLRDLSLFSSLRTKALLKSPTMALELFKLYDPTVRLTNDAKLIEKQMPAYLVPGRLPDIPSLLYSPTGSYISGRSYTFWLKKLKSTNSVFVNLRPATSLGTGYYNIIAKKRGK